MLEMNFTGLSQLGKPLETLSRWDEMGLYLHQVTEAFFTENIPQEAHLFLVVGVRSELRSQQCQGFMQT